MAYIISSSDISKLREVTGAGILDCKKALEETSGDFQAALDWLRKKGVIKAAKRADKVASEGIVASYIHGGGKIGVLVEVNCETDFVAKTDLFCALVNDIAMHIAAAAPQCVSRTEIASHMLERERSVYREQMQSENKPSEIVEKIIEGKIGKFYSEMCLLEQPFIKDEDKTIEQLLIEKTSEIGEKISIRRFARFVLGEGIERSTADFVKDVQEQLG